MVILRSGLSAFFMAALLDLANAHVSLTSKYTEPGKNFNTAFHVPHGCSGSATVALTAVVPVNVTTISPQAVSNWTLHTNYHDATNSSISNFTWTGGYLQPHDALDFPMVLTAPNVDLSSTPNATFYFPVTQVCENNTIYWTDIPESDASTASLKNPAPTMVIVKNATQAAADAISVTHSTDNHSSGASGSLLGLLPAIATISALAVFI